MLGSNRMPVAGSNGPCTRKPYSLACRQARDEYVPVVIGAIGDGIQADHARCLRLVGVVEQQQLDAGGMLARRR